MEIKRTEMPPQIIKPEETKEAKAATTKATPQPTSDSFEQIISSVVPENFALAAEPEKKAGQITGGLLTKGTLQARLGEPRIKADGTSRITIKKTDVKSVATSPERQKQIDHIRSLISEITQEFRSPQKSSVNSYKQAQSTQKAAKSQDAQARVEQAAGHDWLPDAALDSNNPNSNPFEDLQFERKIASSDTSEKQDQFTEDVSKFRNPQMPVPTITDRQEQVNHIRSLISEVNQELRSRRKVLPPDNMGTQAQFAERSAEFRKTQTEAPVEPGQEVADRFDHPLDGSDLAAGLDIQLPNEITSTDRSQKQAEFTEAVADFKHPQDRSPDPDLNRIQKLLTDLLQAAKKL